MSKIIGKVARILNLHELVINKGSRDGIKRGMVFDIYDKNGEDITDPDTGATLGSLRLKKTSVKIIQVQERMSVATTYRSGNVNSLLSNRIGNNYKTAGSFGGLADLLYSASRVSKMNQLETLKAPHDHIAPLDESESHIKTGDLAELVPEDIKKQDE